MDGLRRGGTVRMVTEAVEDNKETVITATLLLYVAAYLLIGIGGITFPAQPAAGGHTGSYYTEPNVTILEPPDPGAWQNETFDVSVNYNDSDAGLDTCNWTIFDSGSPTATDSWDCTSPIVETATIELPEMPPADCGTEGADTCTLKAMANDTVGHTTTDVHDYNLDFTAPQPTCGTGSECDSPDPVKGGGVIRFEASQDRPTGIPNAGVDHVTICRDENCDDTFCSYDADTESSCSYTTPDGVSTTEPYWIRLTDHAGNAAIFPGDSFPNGDPNNQNQNFTVKKGLGAVCTSDSECLLGSCIDNTCQFDNIPAPEIIFTRFASPSLQVMPAGFVPFQRKPSFRIFHTQQPEQLQMQVRNPLPVPDTLHLSLGGSAVAQRLIRVAHHDGESAITCRPTMDQCELVVPADTARHINITVTGERYGRGTLDVTVTSAASGKSASRQLPVGVKAPGIVTQLRNLLQ